MDKNNEVCQVWLVGTAVLRASALRILAESVSLMECHKSLLAGKDLNTRST